MSKSKKIVISALCVALCILLPFLTGNNRQLGSLFSLMHIPVLLCGFICSWPYGLFVGFISPIIRSILVGMPLMPIVAVPMAFELATYGLVSGLLYDRFPKKNKFIFISLICAMVSGRIVNVLVSLFFETTAILLSLKNIFVNTFPGIIIQLILIPIILKALEKANVIHNEVHR